MLRSSTIYRYFAVIALAMPILGYSTQVARIGPLPFAELCVLLALTLVVPKVHTLLTHRAFVILLSLVLIMIALAAVHLVDDADVHGAFAMRDASHYIDMLALVVGYTLASVGAITSASRAIRRARFFVIACMIVYPFRTNVNALLPQFENAHGAAIPLLTYFALPSIAIAMMFATIADVQNESRSRVRARMLLRLSLVAGVGAVLLVQFFQARTIYLQLAFSLVLTAAFVPRVARYMPVIAAVGVVCVPLLAPLGAEFGRLGSNLDLSNIGHHLLAIVGIESDSFADAASGVDLRLRWWASVVERVADDPATLFIGLGFGVPLTDFTNMDGVVVREVHNSLVSTAARLGLVGVASLATLLCTSAWLLVDLLRRTKRDPRHAFDAMFYAVFCGCVVIFSFGEDAFEKSYFAIPFYFFLGSAVRLRRELAARQVHRESRELAFQGELRSA